MQPLPWLQGDFAKESFYAPCSPGGVREDLWAMGHTSACQAGHDPLASLPSTAVLGVEIGVSQKLGHLDLLF